MADVQESSAANQAELMTVGELAKRLRVSVRQVHRLNTASLIPAPLRIGGCVRWRGNEISEWMSFGAPIRAEWEQRQAAQSVSDENR